MKENDNVTYFIFGTDGYRKNSNGYDYSVLKSDKKKPKSSSWINNYHYRFKKDTINNNNFLTQQQLLQIIELPDHGLDGLTVLDLNLNENELGYLGDSLAKAPRLKVSLLKLEEQSVS